MVSLTTQTIIQQTQNWVNEIVIGLNLCPFASAAFNDDKIDYVVINEKNLEQHLQQLADCFTKLDTTDSIETSLLIFPDAYQQFDDYLELIHLSNQLLQDLNYTGIYQLASFHPDYRFKDSAKDDAGNFSNRSPYPMLHVLRESSIAKAIANYKNIETVPDKNIEKLQKIGFKDMQKKLENIST